MAASHRVRKRNVLACTTFVWLLCSVVVYARPIPKEQFATLGDFPDFTALSENVTSEYFSNEVLQQFMHGLGEHYPDYVTVFKIGDSVNGAPILALDIGSTAGDLCASADLCVHKRHGVSILVAEYANAYHEELGL